MSVLTPRSEAHHYGPNVRADHYLYRCYDADGLLLYIGCTVDVTRRISAHRRGGGHALASRWLSVFMTRHEVEGPFRGRDAGRAAEAEAIRKERPLFNYQCRTDVDLSAWMTRGPIATYLIEHGHLDLALETVCLCWAETREAGDFDSWCVAHVAEAELRERGAA